MARPFIDLLKMICSLTAYSSPGFEFIVVTDTSNTGLGGVLSQVQDSEERAIIEYFSKIFSKLERNYCVTRNELLSIVKAVEHFHKYFYGQLFLLRTNYAFLTIDIQFQGSGRVGRPINTTFFKNTGRENSMTMPTPYPEDYVL